MQHLALKTNKLWMLTITIKITCFVVSQTLLVEFWLSSNAFITPARTCWIMATFMGKIQLGRYSQTLTWKMVLSTTSFLFLGPRQTINVDKMNCAVIIVYRDCSHSSITCLVRVGACFTSIRYTSACLCKVG